MENRRFGDEAERKKNNTDNCYCQMQAKPRSEFFFYLYAENEGERAIDGTATFQQWDRPIVYF